MNITNDNDLDIKNILKKEEQDKSVAYIYLRTQEHKDDECSVVLFKHGSMVLLSQAIQKAMRLNQDNFLPIIISCSFAYASALSDEGFENYIKDLHEAREFNTKLIKRESNNT
jgi:uncharacterized protein YcsI (UPF0317 family)